EKEQHSGYGSALIPQLSKDLLGAFPEMKGFSPTNLGYMKRWYQFYSLVSGAISPQLVAKLAGGTERAEHQGIEKAPQVVAESAKAPQAAEASGEIAVQPII